MTERRQQRDRRKLLHRPGGRRITDPEPSHGTRARYQRLECRCTPCKAANAAYIQEGRKQHARGKPPLGTRIKATTTKKQLRQLEPEMMTKTAIAKALGLRNRRVRVHAVITLRKALQIQRLHRQQLADGTDGTDGEV